MKKKICLVIFIVLFVVSILVNVKLLFFSPAVSLKNIPFEGVITEADSGKIVVKGDGTNGCGLTEHYQIYNSDQIKIVNTNDELIQFTDLKKVLSFKLDAPSPCRLDAPDLDLICYASADCLHQHLQVI